MRARSLYCPNGFAFEVTGSKSCTSRYVAAAATGVISQFPWECRGCHNTQKGVMEQITKTGRSEIRTFERNDVSVITKFGRRGKIKFETVWRGYFCPSEYWSEYKEGEKPIFGRRCATEFLVVRVGGAKKHQRSKNPTERKLLQKYSCHFIFARKSNNASSSNRLRETSHSLASRKETKKNTIKPWRVPY